MGNQTEATSDIATAAGNWRRRFRTLTVLVLAPAALFGIARYAPQGGMALASLVFIVCVMALFVPIRLIGANSWRAAAYIAIMACIALLVAVYHLAMPSIDIY